MSAESPRPGWYEDPQNPAALRFWDGNAWTHQTMSREHLEEPTSLAEAPAEGFRSRVKARLQQDQEKREREKLLAEANALHQSTEHRRALENYLQVVQAAAERSDIVGEEEARANMLAQAKRLGGRKLEKLANEMLEQAEASGHLRIGSSFVGVVKAEGFFSQYARKEAMHKVSTGSSITVYSDRLFHGNNVYVIDEFTQAQVFLDGEEQITQRPTLTRMVLFSPLPGSALIPGLALQKKKKNDMRHAEFVVGSREWSINTPVNPDSLQEPRRLAQIINSTADALARSLDRAAGDAPQSSASGDDVVSQLERLHNLKVQGVLSDEEFQQMKLAIISQENRS